MGVAVGLGFSVGAGDGMGVASESVTTGAVTIIQRLTTVTRATITIKVNPSAKNPRERCMVFVLYSSSFSDDAV